MRLRYLHDVYNLAPLSFRLFFRKLLIKCRVYKYRIYPSISATIIALTYRCNGHCYKCSISRYRKNEKEMSTEEVKILIDQLCDIRTGFITFFGGESLLREDVYEIIDYSTKKGVESRLATNGYLLSKKVTEKLKHVGLNQILISIDSSYAKVHDELRGLPGCFKKAMNGIKYCVSCGIPVIINIVATKENLRNGDLENIISLGKRLKVTAVRIIPPRMSGRWLNAREELLEPQDYDKINQLKKSDFVLSEVVEVAKTGVRHMTYCCSKMRSLLYISPYGDVQPCWSVPISFGNIRKKPLKDIFNLIKKYNFNTNSHDCLANDMEFRERYLKRIKSGTSLPIRAC